MNEMRGILAPGRREQYALGGNATITIRSAKTGTRFTYKIVKPKDESPTIRAFVKLLTGPDNSGDYQYLGCLLKNGQFTRTKATRASDEAPSFIAMKWIAQHWEDDRIEVWHEGSCGRCGRKLTVPESIETGIGPVCMEKAA